MAVPRSWGFWGAGAGLPPPRECRAACEGCAWSTELLTCAPARAGGLCCSGNAPWDTPSSVFPSPGTSRLPAAARQRKLQEKELSEHPALSPRSLRVTHGHGRHQGTSRLGLHPEDRSCGPCPAPLEWNNTDPRCRWQSPAGPGRARDGHYEPWRPQGTSFIPQQPHTERPWRMLRHGAAAHGLSSPAGKAPGAAWKKGRSCCCRAQPCTHL